MRGEEGSCGVSALRSPNKLDIHPPPFLIYGWRNRVVVGDVTPPPHSFILVQQAFPRIYKDDVNGFSSISDISFMEICISAM
jgi:hypothetical protein